MRGAPVNPTSSSKAEFPRVSHFLLCYNQKTFLARAIESALAQDYGHNLVGRLFDRSGPHAHGVLSERSLAAWCCEERDEHAGYPCASVRTSLRSS